MIAETQYKLTAADLELLLAVVRGGTLERAGERLSVNASTVFRSIQRIERGLAQKLFERTRSGYLPNETARILAGHAERLESEIEAVRSALQVTPDLVSGSVRITSTDTILHGLVAPALGELRAHHPLLSFDLHSGNEPANLNKRDADIAVRATKRPPDHLVGKHLGPIRVALFAPESSSIKTLQDATKSEVAWIAPDEALPEHPSVLWRKRHFPKLVPVYRVSSILTAAESVGLGLGVAVLPLFLALHRKDMKQISEVLDDCQTELWLLTHPESRHLRRVSTVFGHLAKNVVLR
ncbi:MAG: LysR family transcriptional regulator [Pseudomonadaceae bacterium]|nr:LysR family transcriptional regulator [Pseudomonadaceae bacterium]